ncbi:MmgE/PrpD family protein [Microvirga brassicacearum]|uniref:MmgE/PrpD family protein n=1 Tax=Microvirga brassicacearum TaxID=2580413 RepID=A0A5N3PGK5_9HYPH|nr:MmgE/PrpD family protein [Microvirga brassicacearum]KAB0268872.1 MmgE/PrpD family protein [Microvirga brassicacearum]
MNLTNAFAQELQTFAARPLDASSRDAAIALFVDGLAVSALGARDPGPGLIADLAIESGAGPQATLIGHGTKSSVAEAARVNGAAMHALDFEPMWNPANHALSTTLPAVLALAEREANDVHSATTLSLGSRILSALATGIEAQARLRLSSGQFEPADLVFHPPGAVGPIGSAVACAVFLGLDGDHLTHAIGIAASRAGGILANVGSMTKALHCGQAASSGLEAALLAAKGFTADGDALAGPRGFGAAFFRDGFAPEELTKARSAPHITEPGPAFKLYPSQYGTHFVICAAREAHAKLPAGASIRNVRIICPLMPYVDRPTPVSGLAGKFSFQYTAAVALLDGDVTDRSFTDERRFAPDLVTLLKCIEVVPDPSREGRFDRMHVDLMIECSDGTIVETRCDGPPGIWGRPAGADLLRHKAHGCLAAAFGNTDAERILPLAQDIEGLNNQQFVTLMGLMGGRTDQPASASSAGQNPT